MDSRRVVLLALAAVVTVSAVIRVAALGSLPQVVFDEHYYAHDAKVLLDGRQGPVTGKGWTPGDFLSTAHPEFGDASIAAGIALAGDGPWGWRLPSALAGTALIALVYPLARRLLLPRVWALAATALAASDVLLVVQSRLAMLDIFVALWSAVCVYCALRYVRGGRHARWLVLCGVAGGLALGSKWSGLFALVAAAVVLAADRRPGDRRRVLPAVACLVALPLVVYVATWAAYFAAGHTPQQWLHLQGHLLTFNWRVRGHSPFASPPATWLFDAQPIWYAWALEPGGVRGMFAAGNPLLWIGGVVACVALAVRGVSDRDLRPAMPVVLVGVLYLPWLLTTRQSYIYYMTPVVPFLAVALAAGLARVAGRERPGRRWAVPAAVAAGAALGAVWYAPFATLRAAAGGSPWALAAFLCGVTLVVALILAGRRLLRPAAPRALITSGFVGAVAGCGLSFLPFALGLVVPYEYYRLLTWLPTWR